MDHFCRPTERLQKQRLLFAENRLCMMASSDVNAASRDDEKERKLEKVVSEPHLRKELQESPQKVAQEVRKLKDQYVDLIKETHGEIDTLVGDDGLAAIRDIDEAAGDREPSPEKVANSIVALEILEIKAREAAESNDETFHKGDSIAQIVKMLKKHPEIEGLIDEAIKHTSKSRALQETIDNSGLTLMHPTRGLDLSVFPASVSRTLAKLALFTGTRQRYHNRALARTEQKIFDILHIENREDQQAFETELAEYFRRKGVPESDRQKKASAAAGEYVDTHALKQDEIASIKEQYQDFLQELPADLQEQWPLKRVMLNKDALTEMGKVVLNRRQAKVEIQEFANNNPILLQLVRGKDFAFDLESIEESYNVIQEVEAERENLRGKIEDWRMNLPEEDQDTYTLENMLSRVSSVDGWNQEFETLKKYVDIEEQLNDLAAKQCVLDRKLSNQIPAAVIAVRDDVRAADDYEAHITSRNEAYEQAFAEVKNYLLRCNNALPPDLRIGSIDQHEVSDLPLRILESQQVVGQAVLDYYKPHTRNPAEWTLEKLYAQDSEIAEGTEAGEAADGVTQLVTEAILSSELVHTDRQDEAFEDFEADGYIHPEAYKYPIQKKRATAPGADTKTDTDDTSVTLPEMTTPSASPDDTTAPVPEAGAPAEPTPPPSGPDAPTPVDAATAATAEAAAAAVDAAGQSPDVLTARQQQYMGVAQTLYGEDSLPGESFDAVNAAAVDEDTWNDFIGNYNGRIDAIKAAIAAEMDAIENTDSRVAAIFKPQLENLDTQTGLMHLYERLEIITNIATITEALQKYDLPDTVLASIYTELEGLNLAEISVDGMQQFLDDDVHEWAETAMLERYEDLLFADSLLKKWRISGDPTIASGGGFGCAPDIVSFGNQIETAAQESAEVLFEMKNKCNDLGVGAYMDTIFQKYFAVASEDDLAQALLAHDPGTLGGHCRDCVQELACTEKVISFVLTKTKEGFADTASFLASVEIDSLSDEQKKTREIFQNNFLGFTLDSVANIRTALAVDGKDVSKADIQKQLDTFWKECIGMREQVALHARSEADKKSIIKNIVTTHDFTLLEVVPGKSVADVFRLVEYFQLADAPFATIKDDYEKAAKHPDFVNAADSKAKWQFVLDFQPSWAQLETYLQMCLNRYNACCGTSIAMESFVAADAENIIADVKNVQAGIVNAEELSEEQKRQKFALTLMVLEQSVRDDEGESLFADDEALPFVGGERFAMWGKKKERKQLKESITMRRLRNIDGTLRTSGGLDDDDKVIVDYVAECASGLDTAVKAEKKDRLELKKSFVEAKKLADEAMKLGPDFQEALKVGWGGLGGLARGISSIEAGGKWAMNQLPVGVVPNQWSKLGGGAMGAYACGMLALNPFTSLLAAAAVGGTAFGGYKLGSAAVNKLKAGGTLATLGYMGMIPFVSPLAATTALGVAAAPIIARNAARLGKWVGTGGEDAAMEVYSAVKTLHNLEDVKDLKNGEHYRALKKVKKHMEDIKHSMKEAKRLSEMRTMEQEFDAGEFDDMVLSRVMKNKLREMGKLEEPLDDDEKADYAEHNNDFWKRVEKIDRDQTPKLKAFLEDNKIEKATDLEKVAVPAKVYKEMNAYEWNQRMDKPMEVGDNDIPTRELLKDYDLSETARAKDVQRVLAKLERKIAPIKREYDSLSRLRRDLLDKEKARIKKLADELITLEAEQQALGDLLDLKKEHEELQKGRERLGAKAKDIKLPAEVDAAMKEFDVLEQRLRAMVATPGDSTEEEMTNLQNEMIRVRHELEAALRKQLGRSEFTAFQTSIKAQSVEQKERLRQIADRLKDKDPEKMTDDEKKDYRRLMAAGMFARHTLTTKSANVACDAIFGKDSMFGWNKRNWVDETVRLGKLAQSVVVGGDMRFGLKCKRTIAAIATNRVTRGSLWTAFYLTRFGFQATGLGLEATRFFVSKPLGYVGKELQKKARTQKGWAEWAILASLGLVGRVGGILDERPIKRMSTAMGVEQANFGSMMANLMDFAQSATEEQREKWRKNMLHFMEDPELVGDFTQLTIAQQRKVMDMIGKTATGTQIRAALDSVDKGIPFLFPENVRNRREEWSRGEAA